MDRDEARRIFEPPAREALQSFAIEPATLDLVAVAENITFRVSDARDGTQYVFRLHRPWYHTLEELISERVWLRALVEAGISVPTPVLARDGSEYVRVAVPGTGEQRYAGMISWTEGRLLSEALAETTDAAWQATAFEQLGAITASMHNQAAAWQVPQGFTRHHLDTDGLMGDRPFWGPFWEHRLLTPAEARLLLDTRDRVRVALARYGRDPRTYSLIHADMHPRNVLVDGKKLTVIDFDDTGFGWHLYDIAVALIHQQGTAEYPAAEAAFLRGYRRLRVLPDADLALLPMFHLMRGMVQIGWYHQRPELGVTPNFHRMKDDVCAQCAAFVPP
ncbi:MAG: phosphotransferase [Alphaproteobacteria bacterium]|nr:phosphotransferase [Alphaproteobacteria bacterium]MCW5740865.1 phosphotransferase [Alphaproteobacteria bacterium]